MINYYAVFDKRTGTYSNPFPAVNQGFAIRECKALLMDSSSMFSKFPEDYVLHFCGCFDSEDGFFVVPDDDPFDCEFLDISLQIVREQLHSSEDIDDEG